MASIARHMMGRHHTVARAELGNFISNLGNLARYLMAQN
jgi:hypothetical protein